MDRGNRFAVPSKERRDVMLQKFFENIFDVELYCQMVDLILRLSENTNREQAYREFEDHALFFSCPEQGVEERYGLHYPGEVLERLEEADNRYILDFYRRRAEIPFLFYVLISAGVSVSVYP